MVRDERQPILVDRLLFASGRSSTAEPRGVRDSEEPAVPTRKLRGSFLKMPRSQPAVLCGPLSAAASAPATTQSDRADGSRSSALPIPGASARGARESRELRQLTG